MKPFILHSSFFVLAIALLAPLLSFAYTPPDIFPTGYWGGGLVSCTGTACTQEDLIYTFTNFVYFGMTIALFILAPIFFAWGGLMILIAGGSSEKMSSGKKILTGTVMGVVIVLTSYLILQTFVKFLVISGVGGFPIE